MRRIVLAGLSFFTIACASAPADTTNTPAPSGGTGTTTPGSGVSRIDSPWPVKTRLHVDLWLHGFATIQTDTTKVPYFRPGYVASQRTAKQAANISTGLDANRDRLAARLTVNRDLVGAQFLAIYFGSWDQLVQAADLFIRAEGNPQAGGSDAEKQAIFMFAQFFPTGNDRDWLRLFMQSLQDEHNRWYRTWWTQEQRNRARVIEAVDSIWNGVYRGKLQGYLNRTQQGAGDLLLSIPLDGEGRSVSGGKGRNTITVGFPPSAAEAIEAVYVFAHEAASAVASQAINDNTTPAEKRSANFEFMQSAGLVRGGEMILTKLAPELAADYARFYLRTARVTPSGDPSAQLAREFPLPEPIRAAIQRQIDVVLGGI